MVSTVFTVHILDIPLFHHARYGGGKMLRHLRIGTAVRFGATVPIYSDVDLHASSPGRTDSGQNRRQSYCAATGITIQSQPLDSRNAAVITYVPLGKYDFALVDNAGRLILPAVAGITAAGKQRVELRTPTTDNTAVGI